MFDCIVCLQTWNGRGTRVAGHYVCFGCVRDGIIPKFFAALKNDVNYPPTWGEGITLDPNNFVEFFDNPKEFLQRWEAKMREYQVPYKQRFFCAVCEAFLCAKAKDGSTFNIRCSGCEAVSCLGCGADVTALGPPHVCSRQPLEDKKESNAFEGLERGKHYQICPNPDCEIPMERKDGCNHLLCPSCNADLCFICGGNAAPASGHWDQGKPCPRWNHRDEAHAQYDNPGLAAALRAMLGEREAADDFGGHLRLGDEGAEEREDDDPESIDLLADAIGPDAYFELDSRGLDIMDDLPALPDMTGITHEQQVAAETAMADQLESTPIGQLMLEQKRQLTALLEVAEARIIEAENEDLALPPWIQPAVNLMTALRSNLDLYVYRLRVRFSFAAFHDRHDGLRAARGVHYAEIFRHFPLFFEILLTYGNVAWARLIEAAAQAEAVEGDDETGGTARAVDEQRQVEAAERLSQFVDALEEQERWLAED